MKKLLLVMLTLLTLCGIGCKKKEEIEPVFPYEQTDHIYMTVKNGNISYNISKEDMYINLKNTAGLSKLIEWADENIVTTIGKKGLLSIILNDEEGLDDVDATPYYDLVTNEEIDELIENTYYPNGKENYTEEDIEEIEQDHKDNFYQYGYRSDEEIRKYFRIQVAKKKIAEDYQELVRKDIDFSRGEYETYYKNNYRDTYDMFVIPFASLVAYSKTLKELNVKTEVIEGEGYSRWVKNDTGERLTVNEIIEVYIQLFNKLGIYKDDVSTNTTLKEGEDYNIVDGKYVFNVDEDSPLHYDQHKVISLNSSLVTYINSMKAYNPETSTAEESNWYYALGNSYENDTNFYTVMLLNRYPKKPLYTEGSTMDEEIHQEIKEKLMARELNDAYINDLMSTLRTRLRLVIYDKSLQLSYINEFLQGSVPDTDVENEGVVATFNEKILFDEDFFNMLDASYGPYVAGELVNYYNALYDKNINYAYDLSLVDAPESQRILDKKLWQAAWNTVNEERSNFENGLYLMYGYTSKFSFEDFLEDAYSVRSEKELAYHYIREEMLYNYLFKTYSLEQYGEASFYWEKFRTVMQSLADRYFNATGLQYVITFRDENGSNTPSSAWTDEQKAMAQEFYGLLVEYLNRHANNYEDYVELLNNTWNDTQYLVGENKTGDIFDGTIDLAKYKTAGLVLLYENLGTFAYGSLNEGLSKAAKELWDKDPKSETPQVYGKTSDGYKYIESDNGYHVYFNIRNNDMNRYEGRNIPTLSEIKEYIKDPESEKLTSTQVSMIKNYYEDIFITLIDVYNSARTFYLEQANYEFTFATTNYTSEIYQKTLAITLAETEEQVTYII